MKEEAAHSGEADRAASLLEGQKRILQSIHDDRPLSEVLALICTVVEGQAPGMMCSVLVVDEAARRLRHGAAPGLPADYNEAIDGVPIGPRVGSCGAAAYAGTPCVVEDISTHPNWAEFRALAFERHGLRACWSTPVCAFDGKVLATFAMYYREPKRPSAEDRKLTDFTAHLVAIAINRQRDRDRLARRAGLGRRANAPAEPARSRFRLQDRGWVRRA
ncbi:MAG TPA: GAF domain-containing protein [Polyangiaceae bacterium]|nr:GAF domain-containing protein [Polyangiaceae bacterium]